MKLADILNPGRVAVAVAVTSKKRALEEIARLLALGAPSVAPADILASLAGREKLGSTGLGHGVAIPHGRLAGVSTSVGAFVRLKHPVDYDTHDGQPVDLVFGLLVPQNATRRAPAAPCGDRREVLRRRLLRPGCTPPRTMPPSTPCSRAERRRIASEHGRPCAW